LLSEKLAHQPQCRSGVAAALDQQGRRIFRRSRASGSGRSGLPDNGLEAAAAEKLHRPADPARPVVIDLYIQAQKD